MPKSSPQETPADAAGVATAEAPAPDASSCPPPKLTGQLHAILGLGRVTCQFNAITEDPEEGRRVAEAYQADVDRRLRGHFDAVVRDWMNGETYARLSTHRRRQDELARKAAEALARRDQAQRDYALAVEGKGDLTAAISEGASASLALESASKILADVRGLVGDLEQAARAELGTVLAAALQRLHADALAKRQRRLDKVTRAVAAEVLELEVLAGLLRVDAQTMGRRWGELPQT